MRPQVKELLSIPDRMDYQGERWGRALLRLGNLLALSARDTSRLPLGDDARKEIFRDRAARALALYRRAAAVPELASISRTNTAVLRIWGGDGEALEELRSAAVDDGGRMQLAKVYWDLGREDEAAETVASTEDLQESVLRLRRGCP
jgi:hypothetical protein